MELDGEISRSFGSRDLFSTLSLFANEFLITMELDGLFFKDRGLKDLFSFILLFACEFWTILL